MEAGGTGVGLLRMAVIVLVYIFPCVGRSYCPIGLVGKLPNEAGYGCVKFSGEDVF